MKLCCSKYLVAGSPTAKGDEENSYDYDEEEEEAGGEGRLAVFTFLLLFF